MELLTRPPNTQRFARYWRTVKPLAATYYKITGKPLGVTGEIGEMEAADRLGLTLVPARTKGFDAWRRKEKFQIKTRAGPRNQEPGPPLAHLDTRGL
jgi:hypothetical protein